jgi:ParB-like chromosome segregation protein Spo0J
VNIELWPVSRPTPYARNARKIPQKAVDKVAASIKEFGWKQPIVVDAEGVIVVGHTRLLAAQKLGLSEVPVLVASDLTPAQVKAYRLMDNRVHQETDWDIGLLSVEIGDLHVASVDLLTTGFDPAEIEKLLQPSADQDAAANEAPALPENPVSREGDLWLCGPHRVLCGDSTSEEATQLACGAAEGLPAPFLMVTDPAVWGRVRSSMA